MNPSKLLPVLACLVVSSSFAEEAKKGKVLEAFKTIDPKTLKFNDVKGRIVTTPDTAHPKVLEATIDYARPGGYPNITKTFQAGLMNPKKYNTLRFWIRSNSETSVAVQLAEPEPRKDGKVQWFSSTTVKGTDAWQQISIPLVNFKRGTATIFKDGAQQKSPGSGDPLGDEEISLINRLQFVSHVGMRGTATVGHIMLDDVELIEN